MHSAPLVFLTYMLSSIAGRLDIADDQGKFCLSTKIVSFRSVPTGDTFFCSAGGCPPLMRVFTIISLSTTQAATLGCGKVLTSRLLCRSVITRSAPPTGQQVFQVN